jgi:hypothetical protein
MPDRRARLAAAAVVAAVLVLAVIAYRASRNSGDGGATSPFLGSDTTSTAETNSAKTPETTTSVMLPPVDVDFGVGTAIIAHHIMCTHEDPLNGDSVQAVAAAVALDNDSRSGAGLRAFAGDVTAQNEIVRASIQELHETNRFYADCRPVSAQSGRASSSSQPTSATDSDSLPASR